MILSQSTPITKLAVVKIRNTVHPESVTWESAPESAEHQTTELTLEKGAVFLNLALRSFLMT